MIICITGTPGTGKTKISNELARIIYKKLKIKFKVLHLNDIVVKKGIWTTVDRKRNSKNVDMKKLGNFLKNEAEKNRYMIIESHVAHYFDADVVFVMRTGIKKLRERLEKRKWNKAKIEENLDAERVNLILGESLDMHGEEKCFEIDTADANPESAADRMAKIAIARLKGG